MPASKPCRLVLAVLAAFAVLAPVANAADREPTARVVGATGKVKLHGADLYVHVLVAVPAGQSAKARTDEAIAEQSATPTSSAFTTTGLVWDVLPVIQNYNPAGEPLSAQGSLTNTHGTWSSVSGSRYRTEFGGNTNRCPSLVRECKTRQRYDGKNDVGWRRLSGTTLGVTWYSTSIDEADMALNTRFRWNAGCQAVAGRYDLQTVFLHENGHVAGLDHSSDGGAVMYASYQGVRCALSADDQAGLRSIYPA